MRVKKENRILECFLCHNIIKNKISNLRRHIQLHDLFVTCYKCLECHKTLQNKNNMKIHWTNVHKNLHMANVAPRMIETTRKSKSM